MTVKTSWATVAKAVGMVLLVVLPGGSLVLLAQTLLKLHRSHAPRPAPAALAA